MKKISLGCGTCYDGSVLGNKEKGYEKLGENFVDGYIGIDKGDYGQQYKRDLRRGLPFDNDSIDEVFADNFLEHIPKQEHFGQDDFAFIMDECLRVLKKGSRMKIVVPYAGTKSHYKDPTHHRAFTTDTFTYFEPENTWDYGFNKGWRIHTNIQPANRTEILIIELEKL